MVKAANQQTLGFQTPNVKRYDWTPRNIPSKHRENLRRYDWKTRENELGYTGGIYVKYADAYI